MQSLLLIPWFVAGPSVVELPWGGQTSIQPYGILVWFGLAVGLIVALLFARKFDRSPPLVLDLCVFLVVFSFPTAYLLNGLFYRPEALRELVADPSRFLDFELGFSSFGGIVGAITGGFVWSWFRKESLLRVGEAAAFAGPFGWTFGRLGCFLSHDHPGRVSDFFLAVDNYRFGTPPYQPRHDLGLYDMIVMIGIAVVFLVLVRKPRPVGFYVALLPTLYTPFRFALDFLRSPAGEGGDPRYAGLTPAQYASIALFVVGLWLMRRVLVKPPARSAVVS